MFELKPLSKEGVPEALEKVERYRLLNEPWEAESICLDILRVDPNNHGALVGLLLSLTDQFGSGPGSARTLQVSKEARKLLPRLPSEYERAYYAGIIEERLAKASLRQEGPRSGVIAYGGLAEAMKWYEKAERMRPAGNDDAILRWNACARIIMSRDDIRPESEEWVETFLE